MLQIKPVESHLFVLVVKPVTMRFFITLSTIVAAAAGIASVSAQEAARFGSVSFSPQRPLSPNEAITITYNSTTATHQPIFVDFKLEGTFNDFGTPAPNLLISRNDYAADQKLLVQNATLPDFTSLGNVTYALVADVTCVQDGLTLQGGVEAF